MWLVEIVSPCFILGFSPYHAMVGYIRVGEATNPGPLEMSEQHFVVGTFNPTGLRDKAPYISSYVSWADIWSVAETHLNRHDLVEFRKGLHFAETPLQCWDCLPLIELAGRLDTPFVSGFDGLSKS